MLEKEDVALWQLNKICYPEFPYGPSKLYPEFENQRIKSSIYVSDKDNDVFDAVRNCFYLLGLDKKHFGTEKWNPLGDLISPGNKVVIKPNLVNHENSPNDKNKTLLSLITHPSVLAVVLDYVILALQEKGSIIVGDAPIQTCNFEDLIRKSRYLELIDFYQKEIPSTLHLELKDFRDLISQSDKNGHLSQKVVNSGGVVVDLADKSLFCDLTEKENRRLRITNYNPNELQKHHCVGRHEYCIARDILEADVIINLPKPKTHRKAGITCALKNIVGIASRKEYLPHHCNGSKNQRVTGDSYNRPSIFKALRSYFLDKKNSSKYLFKFWTFAAKCTLIPEKLGFNKDKTYEGSWHGNDTISRTICDLNYIIGYANKSGGVLSNKKQRKIFTIADMVIAGEGDGPLHPFDKQVGFILASQSSLSLDCTAAHLMGAIPSKLNFIKRSYASVYKKPFFDEGYDFAIFHNVQNKTFHSYQAFRNFSFFDFKPAKGWEECFTKTEKNC